MSLLIGVSGTLTAMAASVPVVAPEDKVVLRAEAMVREGKYKAAEVQLAQIIKTNREGSSLSLYASYRLMDVYGNEGRYAEAVREASNLLQLLKRPDTVHFQTSAEEQTLFEDLGLPKSEIFQEEISPTEVALKQKSFQELLQREARIRAQLTSAQDPAAIIALHGVLDESQLHQQQAMNEFRAAYRRLPQEPKATPEVRHLVETLFFTHLNSIDGMTPNDRKQVRALYAKRILNNPSASLAEQSQAVSYLSTLFFEPVLRSTTGTVPPVPDEVLGWKKYLDVFAAAPARETESINAQTQRQELHRRVNDLRRRLTEHEMNALLCAAGAAEKASDWSGAVATYQKVIQRASEVIDPAEQSGGIDRMVLEARRSLPVMKSLDRPFTKVAAVPQSKSGLGENAFLGVDYTVGSNWRGVLGTEGWVLFAPHGDDLCGGSRVLDKTFSYHAYLGDPANTARRWRDPAGTLRYPGSDMPLEDPAISGEGVVSYLDDNGEDYPVGAGPDLYVRLTIPPGKHLLSLPLHFDLGVPGSCYGLYLISGNAAGASGDEEVHCLAAKVVSISDEPGYVRLSISGPANYTLLVRRLTSENANLPALFLDPDQRDVKPPGLSAELPDMIRSAVPETLNGNTNENTNGGAGGPGNAQRVDELTGSEFRKMVATYEGMTLAGTSESVASNASGQGSATLGWAELNKTASTLCLSPSITTQQRQAAALIAWRSQERLPLQAGEMASAYRRFLALRFPQAVSPQMGRSSATSALTQEVSTPQPTSAQKDALSFQLDGLSSLAQQMRLQGRISLAEMADDAAWNTRVQIALFTDHTSLTTDKYRQNALLKQLWHDGPLQYLAGQTVWIWRGTEGPAPHQIRLALDADYAARKAGVIVASLVAADTVAAMQEKADTVKLHTENSGAYAAAPLSSLSPALLSSLSLQLARIWVDEFGADVQTRQNQSDDALQLPVNLIVYIGACQPLLAPSLHANNEEFLHSTPLLRSDQLQTLATALVNRDLFPSRRQSQNRADAAKLLKAIQVQDPHYVHLDRVKAMLDFLEPGAAASPKTSFNK